MARKKTSVSKKSSSKGSLASKVAGAAKGILGGKKSAGGKRRNRGPQYWANKVIVEKLKKKFRQLRYGSVR